jgi:hypothetical protein
VDKLFKTLAKLASSSEFSLAKSENNWAGEHVLIFAHQA